MTELAKESKLAILVLKNISTFSRMSQPTMLNFALHILTNLIFMFSEAIRSILAVSKFVKPADCF